MKKILFKQSLLISFSFFLCHINVAQQNPPMYDQGQKFKDVLNIVKAYYTDTVDEKYLVDDAIAKVLEDLDPHSAYVKADDVKRTEEPLQANFEGVGITFQILKDTITVQEVISGCPAEKVGVRVGDRIVKVDDTVAVFKGLDNNWVIKHLRGPKASKVRVTILRRGSEKPIEFVIQRDKIPIYSLEASYMAAPGIGYVKIARFAATTMQEFSKAVSKLREQGMQHIIVDIQDNTGGYLYTAIDLCNQFLEKDQMIVYTEGKHSPRSDSKALGNGIFKKGKVVVMINEGSASASEILSGCIQDNDRGLIVGRRTWGKGLVQKPFSLPDGSQIKLTTAHYYIPSGRCIQRPYEKGKKDYNDEYSRRLQTGELFGVDTFKQPDSLKMKTLFANRDVYGGGGVSPDFFVPLDTSMGSKYYNVLVRRGFMNQYIVEHLDKFRDVIKQTYPSADDFVAGYTVPDSLVEHLFEHAEKDTSFLNDVSIAKDDKDTSRVTIIKQGEREWRTTKEFDLGRSMRVLKIAMKSNIARNLYDTSAFWRVNNEVNNSFQKALEVIKNDSLFDVLFAKEVPQKGKKKLSEKDKRDTARWRDVSTN